MSSRQFSQDKKSHRGGGRGGRGGRGRGDGGGDERHDIKLSKSLSYVLRHGATKEGLNIREDGYIKLEELFKLPRFKGRTFEEIKKLVKENDKQRFTLKQETSDDNITEWWIRANQGHTLEVNDLELEKITDSTQYLNVVHGTYLKNWKDIESQGLSKMKRAHIHFATGLYGDKDVKSGMRHNCDLFIYIDMSKAIEDNIEFYKSSNGVILTAGNDGILPPKYFLKVVDKHEKILFQN
nr:7405_t:CDS:2 [Entrophospora candida]